MEPSEGLGITEKDNPQAVEALVEFIQNSQSKESQGQTSPNSGKTGQGNNAAIDSLAEFFGNYQEQNNCGQASPNVGGTQQHTPISGIGGAASVGSTYNHFADFSQSRTTPDIPSLNLAQLPQLLPVALLERQNLDFVQLICIDGSKFIDRDNPATKIYNEMRRQGCPTRNEGKAHTMIELQDYWDELALESDKLIVMVFYERPSTSKSLVFSQTFLNALSKFEGAICVVSSVAELLSATPESKIELDNPSSLHTEEIEGWNSLQLFSPNQPKLINNIVGWINAIALEL